MSGVARLGSAIRGGTGLLGGYISRSIVNSD
jgi:hypothetical protein